jgi:fructosamine-3-kinase
MQNITESIKYFGVDIDGIGAISISTEVQKNKWREKRAILFSKLDVEFLISLETNDESKKSEIISKKQQLRDVTKLEMPNTVEEINLFWPDILKD